MSSSASTSAVRHTAEVRLEQRLALRRVELVVDGEVREVEEAVAHSRVLPVDDAETLAVVQEVGVQEIVVTRDRSVGGTSLRDSSSDLVCPIERLGHAPSTVERCLPVRLDHAEGVEHPGDLRAVVERAQRHRHALQRAGSRIRSSGGIAPSTKPVTSHPSGSTNATTSGPIPSAAAASVAASSTVRSIPSRFVSFPATRSTKQLAVDLDLQVVVRDAAPEHLELRATAGPDALDLGRARHARIRSPLGSKSGSSVTTPATHSPKISTATSVPTPCSAGRYAYAIDFSTV